MTQLSIVVPVYNESSLIEELIRRVVINVKKITEDFEIIIVDDGSKDQTWELIEKEAKKDNRFKDPYIYNPNADAENPDTT